MYEISIKYSLQSSFKLMCIGHRCLFNVNASVTLLTPSGEDYVIYKDSRVYTLQMFMANQGDTIIHPEVKLNLPPGVTFGSVNIKDGRPSYSCSADSDVISCYFGSSMSNGTSVLVDINLQSEAVEENVTFAMNVRSGALLETNENTTIYEIKQVRNLAKLELFG